MLSIDTASGLGSRSSWSVILAIRSDGVKHFLIDLRRVRLEYGDLVITVMAMVRRHGASQPIGARCQKAPGRGRAFVEPIALKPLRYKALLP